MRLVWMFFAVSFVPMVMAGEVGQQVKFRGTLEVARPPAAYLPMAFSPDGKVLAARPETSPPTDDVIKLWNVGKRKVIATLRGDCMSMAFSPDGKTLAAGSRDNTVTLWNLVTEKPKITLKGHTGEVHSVAFSPDGKTLASGTREGNPGSDRGEVKLWDVESGKERGALRHSGAVFSVAFSPDGKLIATGTGKSAPNGQPAGGEVTLWDVATRKEKASLKARMVWVWSVAFSPDGKTLASGDVYGNVLLWDVPSGKRTATLQQFNPNGKVEDIDQVLSVGFSPDAKTLGAGTVRGIKLWDVKSGKKVGGLKWPSPIVWSVAFSPDGKTVASSEGKGQLNTKDFKDTTISLWELIPSKKADK